MTPDTFEQVGSLMLDEMGKVIKHVDALPKELQTKIGPFLSQLEEATQTLTASIQAAKNQAGELQQTASLIIEAEVKTTKDKLSAELTKIVAKTAQDIAQQASRKSMFQWAAISLAAACALFYGFGYTMHHLGTTSGREEGYQRGVNETIRSEEYQKSACAWAQDTENQMLLKLDQLGVLRKLTICEGPGWKKETKEVDGKTIRFCVPTPVPVSDDPKDKKTQIWGWQIP